MIGSIVQFVTAGFTASQSTFLRAQLADLQTNFNEALAAQQKVLTDSLKTQDQKNAEALAAEAAKNAEAMKAQDDYCKHRHMDNYEEAGVARQLRLKPGRTIAEGEGDWTLDASEAGGETA